MGLKDLKNAYSALTEFGLLARSIEPIMTDADISRNEKRKALSDLCNNLSESTFNNKIVVAQIMKIINMKEDVSKESPDTVAQVNEILRWCPRMAIHRKELTKEVEKHRKLYGMKL